MLTRAMSPIAANARAVHVELAFAPEASQEDHAIPPGSEGEDELSTEAGAEAVAQGINLCAFEFVSGVLDFALDDYSDEAVREVLTAAVLLDPEPPILEMDEEQQAWENTDVGLEAPLVLPATSHDGDEEDEAAVSVISLDVGTLATHKWVAAEKVAGEIVSSSTTALMSQAWLSGMTLSPCSRPALRRCRPPRQPPPMEEPFPLDCLPLSAAVAQAMPPSAELAALRAPPAGADEVVGTAAFTCMMPAAVPRPLSNEAEERLLRSAAEGFEALHRAAQFEAASLIQQCWRRRQALQLLAKAKAKLAASVITHDVEVGLDGANNRAVHPLHCVPPLETRTPRRIGHGTANLMPMPPSVPCSPPRGGAVDPRRRLLQGPIPPPEPPNVTKTGRGSDPRRRLLGELHRAEAGCPAPPPPRPRSAPNAPCATPPTPPTPMVPSSHTPSAPTVTTNKLDIRGFPEATAPPARPLQTSKTPRGHVITWAVGNSSVPVSKNTMQPAAAGAESDLHLPMPSAPCAMELDLGLSPDGLTWPPCRRRRFGELKATGGP